MRVALLLLVLSASGISQQPAKPSCKSFHFPISLTAGQDFAKSIGEGLTLTIKHEEGADGWEILLLKNDHDYIYRVNLPIRFNPLQIIGPDYGQTLHDQTSDRVMKFLWKDGEFDHISKLEGDVLWQYQTKNPDKAIEDYTRAAEAASLGELRLVVRHFKADKDHLTAIDYDAVIVVPDAFHALTPTHAATCPIPKM